MVLVFVFILYETDRIQTSKGTVLKAWAVVSTDAITAQSLADAKALSIASNIKASLLTSINVNLP